MKSIDLLVLLLSRLLLLAPLIRGFVARGDARGKVVIEAGTAGWDLIEYEELWQSGVEYLGPSRFVRFVKSSSLPYHRQLRSVLDKSISHFIFDSRSHSENIRGDFTCLYLAFSLLSAGIVPVVRLTDYGSWRHRRRSLLLSCWTGLVLALEHPHALKVSFSHGRIFGPMPMALSAATASAQSRKADVYLDKEGGIGFVGSLYPPRTALLEELSLELQKSSILGLEVISRNPNEPRGVNVDYWDALGRREFGLATTDHTEDKQLVDLPPTRHAVFRLLEIPITGAVLCAQEVYGFQKILRPGRDYLSFDNPAGLAETLQELQSKPTLREELALSGRHRVRQLAELNVFWTVTDYLLGRNGF